MSRASPAIPAVSVGVGMVVGVIAVVLGGLACRVGPPVADALVAPYPDSAAKDVSADGDARTACGLLAQDCPNQKTCYPADGVPGATSCELTGSAPPTTLCVMSLECDAREACVLVPESQTMMCVTLCDPAAVQTGCQRAEPCRLLPGYSAGYCVP